MADINDLPSNFTHLQKTGIAALFDALDRLYFNSPVFRAFADKTWSGSALVGMHSYMLNFISKAIDTDFTNIGSLSSDFMRAVDNAYLESRKTEVYVVKGDSMLIDNSVGNTAVNIAAAIKTVRQTYLDTTAKESRPVSDRSFIPLFKGIFADNTAALNAAEDRIKVEYDLLSEENRSYNRAQILNEPLISWD